MLVLLNWLKQYVHLPAGTSSQEVALKLTMSTVEVDGVEEQGKNLEGIVVGKVLEAANHPNADKLKVCQVDLGEKKVQVVCGGSNVQKNMLVAVAQIGSKVRWHGEGELVELKPAAIRGVNSEGMICAATEIGLGERFPAKGEKEILDLSFVIPAKAGIQKKNGLDSRFRGNDIVGKPLAQVLGLNDTIIEIDNKSMTNRPDLWSHYGLARELAAIYNKKFHKYASLEIKPGKEKKITVEVEDTKLCPRYLAVEISNVKVAPSPDWIQEKLLAVGLRPINNIVDITNYVMLDVGNPLHAFDAGLFKADKILVRRAKDGEDFVTLDGQKHKLDSTMLVIADKNKAAALAGIMGGMQSSISNDTEKIIFEAANFDPVTVRRAALKLGLRTDSSVRFEKSLDPNLCSLALQKAVQLTLEICPEATVTSNVADEAHWHLQQGPIETSFSFLNKKMGVELDKKAVVGILERLGFGVKTKRDFLSVTVPTWRATKDISIPEDLVEEVARIYGYDNIKTSLPVFPITPPEVNKLRNLEHFLRGLLSGSLGFSEVSNYSFVSDTQINNLGDDLKKHIALDNPLSKEKPFLRRNLVLNLLENLNHNIEYQPELRLFEVGKTFLLEEPGVRAEIRGDELLPRQDTHLTVIFSAKKESAPFWKLRRAAELIMEELNFSWKAEESKKTDPWQHPGRAAKIIVNNSVVGQIYELNPLVAENFGLTERVAVLEINLDILTNCQSGGVVYKKLSIYPEVVRDVACVVEKKISQAEIIKALSAADSLIKQIELFDVYEGDKIKAGYKSLAYHFTFANPEKTLTTQEVDAAQLKVIKVLQEKFNAEIRQ